MKSQKKTIGRTDKVDLPELGLEAVQAKIDTGAYTSAIHCSKIKLKKVEGEDVLVYTINGRRLGNHKKAITIETKDFSLKKIRSSNGDLQSRYIVKTKIALFNKIYKAEFSLSDRSHMKNPILLGRKILSGKFVVDVTETDLSFEFRKRYK